MRDRVTLAALVLAGCGPVSVEIMRPRAAVGTGSTLEYRGRCLPLETDAHLCDLDWSTDDPEIATIDADGVLTGRRAGRTVVRLSAGTTDAVPVTVTVIEGLARVAERGAGEHPGPLRVNDDRVFWNEFVRDRSHVFSAALHGDEGRSLEARAAWVHLIAVDERAVFVAEVAEAAPQSVISAISMDDGRKTELARVDGWAFHSGVVRAEELVFVESGASSDLTRIWQVPRHGGPAVKLVEERTSLEIVGATTDGTIVYAAHGGAFAFEPGGPPPRPVVELGHSVRLDARSRRLAWRGREQYFSSEIDGPPEPLFARLEDEQYDFAFLDGVLCAATYAHAIDLAFLEQPKTFGSAIHCGVDALSLRATGLDRVFSLALHGEHLYFASGQEILRLPRSP